MVFPEIAVIVAYSSFLMVSSVGIIPEGAIAISSPTFQLEASITSMVVSPILAFYARTVHEVKSVAPKSFSLPVTEIDLVLAWAESSINT